MRYTATIIFTFFVTISQLFAQSWSKTYGNNYTSLGNAAVATRDGGFMIVGYGEGIGGGKSQLQITKTDVAGKELWTRGYGGTDTDLGFDITSTPTNEFILAGASFVDNQKLRQFFVVKIDAKGSEMWSRIFGSDLKNDIAYGVLNATNSNIIVVGSSQDPTNGNVDAVVEILDKNGTLINNLPFGGAGTQEFKKAIEVADGYICVGSSVTGKNSKGQDNRDVLLVKISKTGQILWVKTYGEESYEDAQSIVQLKDGSLMWCGKDTSNIIVGRVDANGTLLWKKAYGGAYEDEANSIIQTKDGNLVLAGNTFTDNSNVDAFAVKINIDGKVLWKRQVGSSQRYETFNHVTQANDGSLFFSGVWGSNIFLITSKIYGVKTEAEGILGNNYVVGKVFYDRNNNCKYDPNDTPLNDWMMQISKPTRSYLGLSNGQGDFSSIVDSGTYQVKLLQQNSYWKQVCQTAYNISLNEQEDTVTVEFALRPALNCPAMEVSINTPQLLRCQSNRYVVNFCNRGTTMATGSYVEVDFDEYFEDFQVNLASWTRVGNKIRCDIGNVPAGACGQFDIFATLDKNCKNTILGQSHRVVAHVYPDAICTSSTGNWDGSSIQVTGNCVNNRIEFKVKNIGTKESPARTAVIIEDDVIFLQKPIDVLEPFEDTTFIIPSSPKTYRIIVPQVANHPGSSNPTVAVEGCTNDNFKTGFVTQFSEDDGDPFVSISVRESRGKSNTNEKIAFPKGYKAQKYIADSTILDYHIYFNNTYGDTLRSLTIIDTLSASLDAQTIREIQSSHRYELTFPQANVLQFSFKDINLPDSSANALRSEGFVKFRLSQKPNNTNGTLIHNRAALFYGDKAYVRTNLVTHQVGKNYLTATLEKPYANVSLKIAPNPFNDVTFIDLKGLNKESFLTFHLFDNQGRLVNTQDFEGPKLQIERNGLPQGIYMFKISQEGKLVGSGKIFIQE